MFVSCLSSLLSVFLPGCEQLHWKYMLDFSELLNVVTGFLKQSDCSNFENSVLMRQALINMYVDIIMQLEILTDQIKSFCLIMVRHAQLCLNQLDSKIIEVPANDKKFQSLRYFSAYGYISIGVTNQCSFFIKVMPRYGQS